MLLRLSIILGVLSLLPVHALRGQEFHTHSAAQLLNKVEEVHQIDWQRYSRAARGRDNLSPQQVLGQDTLFVGAMPHDTVRFTGIHIHTGPIFVFNDGVLIIHNAKVTNYGDVIVFGHGTLLADSSSLTFPQEYFYQRSILAVNHATVHFGTCQFNYSGWSHNLVITDSSFVEMLNVHQNDWTTCGMTSHAHLSVVGMNLGGEYILSDSCIAAFQNVDTLLLWHQLPKTTVLQFVFPQGDTVNSYKFNNTVTGVKGIEYNVSAVNCYQVWWALMPVNGSDVTIANSSLRAIGNWFRGKDSVTVNGLKDNTFYPNVVLPFADRNLHLMNTNVQTWNLYVFDSSQLTVTNSTVGEVGAEQHGHVLGAAFLLDGSGGYFWGTDTTVIYANGVVIYSTARSEHNSIFLLANSWLPFQTASSIGNSLFVSVQNKLPSDPIPYDQSAMWMENIQLDSLVHADSLIPIQGDAWIDQGPQGSWMDWSRYSLSYQKRGGPSWVPIVGSSTQKIRHSVLGTWNTNGLDTGTYLIRLLVWSSLGDSVQDVVPVVMLPSVNAGVPSGVAHATTSLYPNPATDFLTLQLPRNVSNTQIRIYDLLGTLKIMDTKHASFARIAVGDLRPGVYVVEVSSPAGVVRERFVKE